MTGTQDPSFERNAITTYRYLRLAIVVVVVALWVGVFVEYAKDDCLQRSLSAYYHTPVHALFIGAMMTIGVCLIVIKGRTGLEDTLLNLAGVLALVVAFVPTTVDVRRGTQQPLCTSSPLVMPRPDRFIANNLLALAVGGVIAIAVAYGIASVRKITVMTAPGRVGRIGFGLLAALLIVGVVPVPHQPRLVHGQRPRRVGGGDVHRVRNDRRVQRTNVDQPAGAHAVHGDRRPDGVRRRRRGPRPFGRSCGVALGDHRDRALRPVLDRCHDRELGDRRPSHHRLRRS